MVGCQSDVFVGDEGFLVLEGGGELVLVLDPDFGPLDRGCYVPAGVEDYGLDFEAFAGGGFEELVERGGFGFGLDDGASPIGYARTSGIAVGWQTVDGDLLAVVLHNALILRRQNNQLSLASSNSFHVL